MFAQPGQHVNVPIINDDCYGMTYHIDDPLDVFLLKDERTHWKQRLPLHNKPAKIREVVVVLDTLLIRYVDVGQRG